MFRTLSPSIVGEQAALKITIRPVAQCGFGSMEAINFDLMGSRSGTRMLLSLEPLLSFSDPAQAVTKDISSTPGLHKKGFHTDLFVPDLKEPTILGIFVCKDSSNKALCGHRELKSIRQILETYQKGRTFPKGFRASDKIYYFNYLVFADGQVYVPNAGRSKEKESELRQFLVSLGFEEKTLDSILTRAKEISNTLGSPGVRLGKNNELEIILFKYSPGKCV